MEFNIVKELNGKYNPIVLIKTDEKPQDATMPKPGRGGCVMAFISQTIAKRKTTSFGRENITCGGIATGMGWGDGFNSPEDMEFQATFLSMGQDSAKDKDAYLKKLEKDLKMWLKCSGKANAFTVTLTQPLNILKADLFMTISSMLYSSRLKSYQKVKFPIQ